MYSVNVFIEKEDGDEYIVKETFEFLAFAFNRYLELKKEYSDKHTINIVDNKNNQIIGYLTD